MKNFYRSIKNLNLSALINKPSILFFVFTICFASFYNEFLKPYNASKGESNFTWDGMGYYSYLPSTFFYNHTFEFEYERACYLGQIKNGPHFTKYTYGVALMESPFFFIAWLNAKIAGEKLNGFSVSFLDWIRIGNIFFVLFGLFLLSKFLLHFFDETVVAITLFACLFGSMLYMYTFIQSELSHGYLFALFCAFIYFTHKWHLNQKWKYWLALSIILSIISITRFTEIYIALIFVFWDVKNFTQLKNKISLLKKNYKQALVFPLIALIFWLPQFFIWKKYFGSYFTNPYVGERFFWNDPQILNVLFSYRKGWITYTPIVLLAIVGIPLIKKDFPLSKWLIAFLLCATIYVFSCWWDWNYGGCFGNRAFCQLIAVLSIPMASVISFMFYKIKKFKLRNFLSASVFVFVFSCAFLNFGQSYQFRIMGLLHGYQNSKEIYWNMFNSFHYKDEFMKSYTKLLYKRNEGAWINGLERDDTKKY